MLSPSYTHEKLVSPSFSDLVDVFEDLWSKLIFEQAELLLSNPNGDMAAMTILMPYFESIECFTTGLSSKQQSGKFFVNGFCRVFTHKQSDVTNVAKELYRYIRCGLAHEGFIKNQVNYSRGNPNAFVCTYKLKADKTLDIDAGLTSVIVNPKRMYECIILHFNKYLKDLKIESNVDLRINFNTMALSLWAEGPDENIVGMTEQEFLNPSRK
jgi:hypothetical protein